MTTPRRIPFVRHLLVAVVTVPLVAPLVSCGPAAGDCTTAPGDDGAVSAVSCTDPSAQGRVLQRLDITESTCSAVPGAAEQVPLEPGNYENPYILCVGPKDGPPPERAVNVAPVGGCLTDVGVEPVQQTPCSTPGAYRILTRDPYVGIVVPENACDGVPGATATYQWRQVDTQYPALATTGSVYFCLNHADLDASRSPDLAKPGDCLRTLPPGRGQDVEIVACSDPRADRRLVLRGALPYTHPETVCRPAPGTTATVVRRDHGPENEDDLLYRPDGYVLCLAPV